MVGAILVRQTGVRQKYKKLAGGSAGQLCVCSSFGLHAADGRRRRLRWCRDMRFSVGFLVCVLALYDWFLHLGFWRGVLALVIWPYYIGVRVSVLVH